MKHDELLAKIDAEGEFLVQYFDCKPVFISALRAVVVMHEPIIEIDLEDDEGNLFTADFCDTCPDSPEYPCITIQAIWAVLNA
jgi:hypothetical protein